MTTQVTTLIAIINKELSTNILSRRQVNEVVEGRMILYAILRESRWTFPAIAKIVNRDHSTVMHALKRFNALHDTDERFADTYNRVREQFFSEIGYDHPVYQMTSFEIIEKYLIIQEENKELTLQLKSKNKELESYKEIIRLAKEYAKKYRIEDDEFNSIIRSPHAQKV